jgi:hypothetical protein
VKLSEVTEVKGKDGDRERMHGTKSELFGEDDIHITWMTSI